MHEDLVRLQQMDTHDRAAVKAELAARTLEGRRREAEEAVAAVEARLRALDDEAQALRKEELTTQRSLEQARTYRSRAAQALEQGLGDADAAQRQLEQTTVQIDDLETALLEHLEATDALGVRRETAEQDLADAQEALRILLDTFDEELAAHHAEAKREQRALEQVAEHVAADLRGRYEDLRAKRQWAVARIREGACNACNSVVRQQHITDLRRGLLKPCMGCHRFLVIVE